MEAQLDPELLQRYERLNQRHGRAIVPVINGVCYGCFMRLPTSTATESSKRVLTCENCGRILYWLRSAP
jgi:predicted  nucleic acid-binding Zn-ribbon protein